MAPTTQNQWTSTNTEGGFEKALQLDTHAAVPEVGDNDVLVKFRAVSLNYRDIAMPLGKYPFPYRDGVVPCSDGAGVVEAIGSKVHRFKPGDRVMTVFHQGHIAGHLNPSYFQANLGGDRDGALREYGAFDQQDLVSMPRNLSFLEASTLTCAGVTAWNCLYGLQGRRLMPGDWVLTQGTGGVSIFALQLAKAAGARVIATTSSAAKAEKLKALGADHVIDYTGDTNWGETAKKLTGGEGISNVIEVGGAGTLKNSLAAVKFEGLISLVGFLSGSETKTPPSLSEALSSFCIARGVGVGSRQLFEDLTCAIEANDIHPVVDKEVFKFDKARDAFQYLSEQKHVGKVCVKID